jgi:phosphoglycerol transferase MdoB-like AlkP superfamily enzyme
MLTEKCPFCGSYNDVQAAECYFCHKELPNRPGQKKKKRTSASKNQTVTFSSPATPIKRKSPPGCLVGFSGLLIALCVIVIFQWINGVYHFIQWKLPIPSTDVGVYFSYYLDGLTGWIDRVLQYPIPVVVTIAMMLFLCWGMMNLKKWARTLALILLGMLLIANFALFVFLVMHFYTIPENVISFILLLIGILINAWCLLWFFEHKKTFE